MGSTPLQIRFDEIDGFIKIYDGTRYLQMFSNILYDTIKYPISKKTGIADSINHSFGRIRSDSHNSLPIEKVLTFHNVVILSKSVVTSIRITATITFLEKCS